MKCLELSDVWIGDYLCMKGWKKNYILTFKGEICQNQMKG